jgi:rubrerythrin
MPANEIWDHKQMKAPAKNSQSGRWNHEPKEVCPVCKEFMRKQSIRTYWDKKAGWWPTSWICLKCGHMELDKERFEA